MTTGTPASAGPAADPLSLRGRGERRHDVDLLRVVASVAVVVLHTSGLLLPAAIRDPAGGVAHWVALGGDTVGRFAVPAFFAISGWALLVASPPTSGAVVLRRVARVAVPLGSWTVIYLLWNAIMGDGGEGPSTGTLAVSAIFGPIRPAFHLWYLYGYVPLLMLLGCVSLVVSRQSLQAAGVALIVVAVLPTVAAPVATLTGIELPDIQWGLAFYQVAFAVGGAALLSRSRVRRRRLLIVWVAVGFGAVLWWGHSVSFPSPYGTVAVAVYTAAVMLLVLKTRVPDRARRLIQTLADASFGVYLLHLLVLQAALTWVVTPDSPLAAAWLLPVSLVVVGASFLLSMAWGKLGWRRVLG